MELLELKSLQDDIKICIKTIKEREKASKARRALHVGSTRARVTTANARWAIKSEAYERSRKILVRAIEEFLYTKNDCKKE